jgi:ectoine hydroxylase-related dioxygenase (phytanoyl-CoA dioxygenase family)
VWGHYAESTPAGPVICRTENVSACQPAVAALVDGPLHDVAAAAMGGPVVAFKDKVNYKQPGGAGFSPHQDLPAYPGVRRVVSVLLAVDACSKESGCLWLAEPSDDVLPMDERGVIAGRVARDLDWSPAELAAGDAVCIDGLAPHYSGPNRGMTPRRVLVVSYAPAAEGYDRSTYYAERRAAMAAAFEGDGRSRISVLADFDGEQVTPDEIAMDRCTHP